MLMIGVLLMTPLVTGMASPQAIHEEAGVNMDASAQQSTPSFNVTWATSKNTSLNETTTIEVGISNPSDETSTQPVELRFYGELIETQSIRLSANESTTVTFTVNIITELHPHTEFVEEGTWIHFTVQTEEHGHPTWLYVENSSAEQSRHYAINKPASVPVTTNTQ